ncbi:hypothetical protein DVA76_19400, partial [Acinetobacter baumannii]
MGNLVFMNSPLTWIGSKCILALTLPASGCSDTNQTLLRALVLKVFCFFLLGTESKHKMVITQWDTL